MKFTSIHYPIIRDLRLQKLTCSNGFENTLVDPPSTAEAQQLVNEFKTVRSVFNKNIKIYYLERSIIQRLISDIDLNEKLYGFIKEIKQESGVLLLPVKGEFPYFTSIYYHLMPIEGGCQFKVTMCSRRGADIYASGYYSDTNQFKLENEMNYEINSLVAKNLLGNSQKELNEMIRYYSTFIMYATLFKQSAEIETIVIEKRQRKKRKVILHKEKYLKACLNFYLLISNILIT